MINQTSAEVQSMVSFTEEWYSFRRSVPLESNSTVFLIGDDPEDKRPMTLIFVVWKMEFSKTAYNKLGRLLLWIDSVGDY